MKLLIDCGRFLYRVESMSAWQVQAALSLRQRRKQIVNHQQLEVLSTGSVRDDR